MGLTKVFFIGAMKFSYSFLVTQLPYSGFTQTVMAPI